MSRLHEFVCAGCGVAFEAQRSNAKWHSAACRKRTQRAAAKSTLTERTREARDRKAAEAHARAEEATESGKAEHGLVRAVRKELTDAGGLETVAGQLALQIARRIADPDGAGVSALSKELRSLLEEAKGAVAKPADPDPTPTAETEDEVTKARRLREEARQAAGLA